MKYYECNGCPFPCFSAGDIQPLYDCHCNSVDRKDIKQICYDEFMKEIRNIQKESYELDKC